MAAKSKPNIDLSELCDKAFADELALSICSDGKVDFDPIFEEAQSYIGSENQDPLEFVRIVVAVLYRIGAIGVKLRNSDKILYSHIDAPLIAEQSVGMESRIRVHPMLHGSFRINAHA